MSQQSFNNGDLVHIKAPGHKLDGRDGCIDLIGVAQNPRPYRVQTNGGCDWFTGTELEVFQLPQRDAIPPQPAPKLPPVVREMETAAAKIGTQEEARTSLPVQPGERKIDVSAWLVKEEIIETFPNGAKQSKLGHWWSTPYAALAVARVMSEGHAKYDEPGTTPAQGNWHGIPVWSNIQHALTHLMLYAIHDKSEDHLAHAATRLMMALDQRESGRDKG